jgi:hypothetical protein
MNANLNVSKKIGVVLPTTPETERHEVMSKSHENDPKSKTPPKLVMYDSVCKFWWGERGWEENGFHIWPRSDDRELVKGKA